MVLESLSKEKKKNPGKDPQTLQEYVDGFTDKFVRGNNDRILEEISIVKMAKEIRYLKGIIDCILGPTQTNIRNEVIQCLVFDDDALNKAGDIEMPLYIKQWQ